MDDTIRVLFGSGLEIFISPERGAYYYSGGPILVEQSRTFKRPGDLLRTFRLFTREEF